MEDKEVVEAIVASLVEAVNERLENAAKACENIGDPGDGDDYAKAVRGFKVDASQINVVRE